MRIETYGTAFTSYDVKANKLSHEEISKENISVNSEIKETNDMENISYHTTTKSANSKFTVFKDPTNDKYVVSSLNNSTIEKLKTQFSEDNFVEKEDGSLRLTGEAEAFVSGWFADIAYKREFLESDVNNDGKLSEDEERQTKNDFGLSADLLIDVDNGGNEKLLYASETIDDAYRDKNQDTMLINYREFNIAKSLDDELNTTILVDVDFDGIMTLSEAYTTEGDGNAENVVLRHFKGEGLPTEFVKESEMGLIDILIVDAFDKFVQLEPDERKEYLSKLQEEMLEKSKEKRDEKIKEQEEIALEKHLKKLIEDKKFDEEMQINGLEIHV